jgi:hypothetical protein
MWKEKLPTELSAIEVVLLDSSLREFKGIATVKRWTPRESFRRGFVLSARFIVCCILVALPFALLEPFAFLGWGSLLLLFLLLGLGPYLHLKYADESVSFFYVDGQCPVCHQFVRLTPFVSTQFSERFTVLCPACGQSATARQNGG